MSSIVTKSVYSEENLFEMYVMLITERTKKEVADILNVSVGTLQRWELLGKIPYSYIFDFLKLLKQPIDYSLFDYKEKDQFFTPLNTAEYCYNIVKDILKTHNTKHDRQMFIEPSAGNGMFFSLLPVDKRIGMDIEPRHDELLKQDFLEWTPQDNEHVSYIVIGNPPFGLRGHMALKFINHASTFSEFVCFILPQLFESDGKGVPRKRVKKLNLLYSEKLNTHFENPDGKQISIQCIFQVWSKYHKNSMYNIQTNENNILRVYSLSDGGTPSTTRNKKMFHSCDIFIPSTCYAKEQMTFYNSFDELPRRKGYGIVFLKEKEKNIEKFKTIQWSNVAFLSTNSALNLRSSQIIKQFV